MKYRHPTGFLRAPVAMALSSVVITAGMLLAFPAALGGAWAYLTAASVSGYLALGGMTALLSPRGERRQWLGLGPFSVRHAVMGVAAMMCLYPLLVLIAAVSAALVPASTLEVGAETASAMDDMGTALRLLAFAAAPAFGEELLCRGMVYSAARRYGRVQGILVPAVCFAVLHGNLQQCLYAFVSGLLLSALRDASGSLWPCIAAHFAFNAVSAALPGGMPAVPVPVLAAGAALLPWASVWIVRSVYGRRVEAPPESGTGLVPFVLLMAAGTCAAVLAGHMT